MEGPIYVETRKNTHHLNNFKYFFQLLNNTTNVDLHGCEDESRIVSKSSRNHDHYKPALP